MLLSGQTIQKQMCSNVNWIKVWLGLYTTETAQRFPNSINILTYLLKFNVRYSVHKILLQYHIDCSYMMTVQQILFNDNGNLSSKPA
jgi:hypothetical protein